MLTSARYGISYPNTAPRTDSPDVPRDFAQVVAAVERSVMYGVGTLAARPTSTPGSPGIGGRVYKSTDGSGLLYYDYGTGWMELYSQNTKRIDLFAAGTTDQTVSVYSPGDTQPRLSVRSDGLIYFGPGGATSQDAYLNRVGPGILNIASSLIVSADLTVGNATTHNGSTAQNGVFNLGANSYITSYAGAAAATVLVARQTGQVANRITILNDGSVSWGDGTNPPDVNLYRGAANVIQTDDELRAPKATLTASAAATVPLIAKGAGSQSASLQEWQDSAGTRLAWVDNVGNLQSKVAFINRAYQLAGYPIVVGSAGGDSQDRIIIKNDGRLDWGPGNATQDITLYRAAAGLLRTDTSLYVGNFVSGPENANAPRIKMRNGSSITFDYTGGQLHFYVDGTDVKQL